MATYLDAILAAHRDRAAADERLPVRDLGAALTAARPGLAVMAEIKRRSPSKGELAGALDPSSLAREYAAGGAAALSVLTDGPHFGGSPDDLRAARRAAPALPVLRKDFTVSEIDVVDGRAMGADAILLIVAALDDPQLRDLHAAADAVGLAVLVEAHDEREVERAVAAGARIVGVNQRDLVTFEVDTGRAVRVAAAIPDGVVKVAESGVRGPDDARRLWEAGYDAVLVGEHLVTSGDPARAVKELVAACS